MSLALEDVAAIGTTQFESALRQNLSMAMSDAYDTQCINGNGTLPNVEGLIKQLTDPTDPTSIAKFETFLAAYADAIDGLWATTLRDIAIVCNVDAYKLSAKSYRDKVIDSVDTNQVRAAASLGDITAADYLREKTGGWFTNKRMPATASNVARGIIHRKGQPGVRTASHPTWGSLNIDDMYTDSAKGERHFTMHVLVGSKVLIVQPNAYGLVEFKVS